MVLGVHVWVAIICFSYGINSYLTLLALESTQGPKGYPDGQVLAISGPVVVLGGHGWVPIIHFLMGIISYLTFLALESTQGPEGAQDGQVLGRFLPL